MHRQKDTIKMHLKETGYEVVDWIHLAQNRAQLRVFVNTIMNLRFPLKVANFLISFSSKILLCGFN
jgi:hypothetical protein